MDILTAKAQAVQADTGLTPDALPVGTIIQIITQIMQFFSKCNPAPAQIHQTFVHPTRRQDRIMGRIVDSNIDDPAMSETVKISVKSVGGRMSVADTKALYEQATTGSTGGVQQTA